MKLDETSLLAEVEGNETLSEIEAALAPHGLTLGLETIAAMNVADWIALGSPGARSPFADPADHVIAGLVGSLGPRRIEIRPCPRRAVGPDLVALFAGTGERLGRVERAWLRVHRPEAARPHMDPPRIDLDPETSDAEARLVDAIRAAMFTS